MNEIAARNAVNDGTDNFDYVADGDNKNDDDDDDDDDDDNVVSDEPILPLHATVESISKARRLLFRRRLSVFEFSPFCIVVATRFFFFFLKNDPNLRIACFAA